MTRVITALVLAVAAWSTPAAAPPSPPAVDVGVRLPRLRRVETTNSRRAALPVKELLAERLDVATLPRHTPITLWLVDERIVAFRLVVDGAPLTALRARVSDLAFCSGGGADDDCEAFVDDAGRTLSGDTLASPVDAWTVSSRVGERIHPITHRRRFHAGTDYAAPTGTPVVSIKDGVVIKSARSWSAGRYVVVRHHDKSVAKYFHLDERLVEEGARVKKGDLVGVVGATGRVTGPHLHFELRDARGVPLDMAAERWPGRAGVDDGEARALAFRRLLLDDGVRERVAEIDGVPPARKSAVDVGAAVASVVGDRFSRARGTRRRRR